MNGVWIAVFISIALIFAALLTALAGRSNRKSGRVLRRLKSLSRVSRADGSEPVPVILRDDQLSRIPVLNRMLAGQDISARLQAFLDQAGSNMKVGQLVLLVAVFAAAGLLLSLRSHNVLLRLLLPPAFAGLPVIHVQTQRARRLKAFIRAFPDTIDMMTSAIRAGHAFNQAMQLVGDEAPDPVGVEFKRTFEQHNLGLNIREALLNLTDRVDSLDLRLFVTSVLLQRETGGNLTEILEKISYTIRERFKLIGQIRTYTAQGRMSAWIVGTLPMAFVLIISALNPGYLKPLLQDRLGHLFIGASAFLQVAGFLIIRKVVQIRYQ
ncbi:MAG: type II secretion system F family protein [bacterium]|nr:type II secretion system F family protein [bacterium]